MANIVQDLTTIYLRYETRDRPHGPERYVDTHGLLTTEPPFETFALRQ